MMALFVLAPFFLYFVFAVVVVVVLREFPVASVCAIVACGWGDKKRVVSLQKATTNRQEFVD